MFDHVGLVDTDEKVEASDRPQSEDCQLDDGDRHRPNEADDRHKATGHAQTLRGVSRRPLRDGVRARQTLNASGVHTIFYVAYLNYARQLYKLSRHWWKFRHGRTGALGQVVSPRLRSEGASQDSDRRLRRRRAEAIALSRAVAPSSRRGPPQAYCLVYHGEAGRRPGYLRLIWRQEGAIFTQ